MARNTTIDKHISVIIPVYDEAVTIGGTIDHLRRSSGDQPVEVVVADGGPVHATLAALQDDEVVKVVCPQGRAVQMNAGAAMATGDIFLFLHADTRLPDGWPGLVRDALTGGIRAGAFSLVYDSDRAAFSVIAFFANLRARCERVPYGDQAPFVTAELFRELGGYANIPLMEDVEFFQRIRHLGERIRLLRERVATSPRRYEAEGVVRRVLSNVWLRIRYGFGVSAYALAEEYRPHTEIGKGENR